MTDQNNRYTVNDFVSSTAERDRNQGLFKMETERLLEVAKMALGHR